MAANVITATAINADAITAAKVADGTIDAATFAAGAINAAAIATDAIDADAIAADAKTELRSLVSGTSDSGSTTTMVDAARTEADVDYWKGCWILFTSGNIAGQVRLITGFTPASDTITFAPATTQAVTTQTYEILPAGGVDVRLWVGSAPNVLQSGRVDSYIGALAAAVIAASNFAAGAIDAAAIATGAIDADAIADNAIDAGALATGAITNAKFAAGAIDAAAIAADAIGASELAADAASEIGTAVWATTTRTLTALGFQLATADFVAGFLTASLIATGAVDADALATDAVTEIVNAIFISPTSDWEASAPVKSLGTAVMKAVHRIRDNAGSLEVYRSNGTTLHASQTVTTDAALNPIDELTGAA
jgi:hypothetical protein